MVNHINFKKIPENYCACPIRTTRAGRYEIGKIGCTYHSTYLQVIKGLHCFNMADPEIHKWWYTHLQKCSNPQRCFLQLSTRYG